MPKKNTAGASTWVDPDDAPELTDAFFAKAEVRKGETVVRRGRPTVANPKVQVTLRLDQDVVERMRATGPRWQSRINAALRKALDLPKAS